MHTEYSVRLLAGHSLHVPKEEPSQSLDARGGVAKDERVERLVSLKRQRSDTRSLREVPVRQRTQHES
jgi:hypothetical protein